MMLRLPWVAAASACSMLLACTEPPEPKVRWAQIGSQWLVDGELQFAGKMRIQYYGDEQPVIQRVTMHGVDANDVPFELDVAVQKGVIEVEGDESFVTVPFFATAQPLLDGAYEGALCPRGLVVTAEVTLGMGTETLTIEGVGAPGNVCEQCPEPEPTTTSLPDLGLGSDWEYVLQGTTYEAITGAAIDPDGAMWVVGTSSTGAAITRVDPQKAGAILTSDANPLIATGDSPGVVVASVETSGLRVARYDGEGALLWSHEVSQTPKARAALTVSNGRVVVAVVPTDNVEVDGEVVAPAGPSIVTFDEETGAFDRAAPSFAIEAIAPHLDGAFVASGSRADGSERLAILESDFTERWNVALTSWTDRGIVAAGARGEVYLFDRVAHSVSSFSERGQPRWLTYLGDDSAISLAPLPQGGVLFGGVGYAYTLDDRGEIETSTTPERTHGLPWCEVVEAFAFTTRDAHPGYAVASLFPSRDILGFVRAGRF